MAMSRILSLVELSQTPDVSGRISDVAELRSPCGDLFEWFGMEAIVAMPPHTAGSDQAATTQHSQMLGKRGLRHVKGFAELGHRELGFMQLFQDTSSCRVRNR